MSQMQRTGNGSEVNMGGSGEEYPRRPNILKPVMPP